MFATCPNNPSHERFYTVAHVMEEWVVDPHGEFIESGGCIEVTHPPNIDNVWVCVECGARALVTKR